MVAPRDFPSKIPKWRIPSQADSVGGARAAVFPQRLALPVPCRRPERLLPPHRSVPRLPRSAQRVPASIRRQALCGPFKAAGIFVLRLLILLRPLPTAGSLKGWVAHGYFSLV